MEYFRFRNKVPDKPKKFSPLKGFGTTEQIIPTPFRRNPYDSKETESGEYVPFVGRGDICEQCPLEYIFLTAAHKFIFIQFQVMVSRQCAAQDEDLDVRGAIPTTSQQSPCAGANACLS